MTNRQVPRRKYSLYYESVPQLSIGYEGGLPGGSDIKLRPMHKYKLPSHWGHLYKCGEYLYKKSLKMREGTEVESRFLLSL